MQLRNLGYFLRECGLVDRPFAAYRLYKGLTLYGGDYSIEYYRNRLKDNLHDIWS
jgi:hypothetical protein